LSMAMMPHKAVEQSGWDVYAVIRSYSPVIGAR
jgi:hypothetical protein